MNSRSGFTLIEILVALGVLAIGMTSVFALLAAGGATHRKAISQTTAAFIAESVFSALDEQFEDMVDSDTLEVTAAKMDGYPGFTYDLRLRPLDRYGYEYLAVCTVKWKKAGQQVSLAFTGILLRRMHAADKGKLPSPHEP